MKQSTYILFYLLWSPFLLAQNNQKIDAIKKQLAAAITDSAIVELTTDLAFEVSDADQAKALSYFLEAEALSKKSGYQRGMLSVYLGKGALMDDASKFDSAMLYYDEGLSLAEKMKDLRWQSSYNINIGLIYLRQSRHPEAMKHYNIAQQFSEQAGDEKGMANILRKKASLVLQDLDYKRAHEYYSQAITVYAKLKDSGDLGESLGSKGFAYRNEGKNDSAIFYFQKAITIFKAIRYTSMIAVAYTEIGKALFEQTKYKEALYNYTVAEKIYDTVNYMSHQDALQVFIGDVLIKLNDVSNAKTHYEKGLQLALGSKDMEQHSEALYGLFKVNQIKKNFGVAIGYLESYDSLKDMIAKNEQLATVTEMTEKFESVKKEHIIQLQNFELTKKNYWIYGSFSLILLGTLLGYSYYRRYRLRQEKKLQTEIIKQQDISTRAILQAEENERERIARELHDGVGQMMSAAKMNLSAMESDLNLDGGKQKMAYDRIVNLVDESCREVRAVSHQMMPNALLKKGLASAIREFVDNIDHRVLKVDLYSEGLNERIDANTETVLYRVVQECVNNVIKHSGANHLDISLIKDADGISVTIEDNGKGFDTGQKEGTEGIGLKNVRTRIEYLKGTVDFDSTPGRGTLVAIHVPVAG
ncbi:MAG: sensor histidine kinase [Chitinophagaceae bacterium]